MKRRCKYVDITDIAHIRKAVLECLKHAKKRKRRDTVRLFMRLLNLNIYEATKCLENRDDQYFQGVELLCVELRERLLSEELSLPPVSEEVRKDPGSGKLRTITVLSIDHLLLDHVVVCGMQELCARISAHQVSSIPKRGAKLGKLYLERWTSHSATKYAVKLDVKNFYGSIDRERLLRWLGKRVKNEKLLWLIRQLIYSAKEGMAIGSYLSQTLANIYLSDLWHYAKEQLFAIRRGKRIPFVKHALFYMDDMVFLGTSASNLKKAAFAVVERAKYFLGLVIKSNWNVFTISRKHPIDMMGYRVFQYFTTLRKRVFKRVRRAIIRFRRLIQAIKRKRYGNNMPVSYKLALRLMSYKGYTKHVNMYGFLRKHNAYPLFTIAAQVISHVQKSKLLCYASGVNLRAA